MIGLGQPGVPFASRTPPQAINCRRVATTIDRRTGAVWRRATRTGHPDRCELIFARGCDGSVANLGDFSLQFLPLLQFVSLTFLSSSG